MQSAKSPQSPPLAIQRRSATVRQNTQSPSPIGAECTPETLLDSIVQRVSAPVQIFLRKSDHGEYGGRAAEVANKRRKMDFRSKSAIPAAIWFIQKYSGIVTSITVK